MLKASLLGCRKYVRMDDRPDTVSAAARRHWRNFAPLWAAPIIFSLSFSVGQRIGDLVLSSWVVGLLFGGWAFHRASGPWLDKQIRYKYQFLFGMVFPFLIGAVCMFLFE